MNILLLAIFSWQNLIVDAPNQVMLVDTHNRRSQPYPGLLITQTGAGAVIQQGNDLHWIPESGQPLKLGNAPLAGLVPMQLPFVSTPVAVGIEKIAIWHDQKWHLFDLAMWTEFSPDANLVGGFKGFTAIAYQLVQMDRNRFIAYNPKTGVSTTIGLAPQKVQQVVLSKRLHLLRGSKGPIWMGLPKEGRLGLATWDRPYQIKSSQKIDYLSEHSFALVQGETLWVATFSERISDLLANWKTELMTLLVTPVSLRLGTTGSTSKLELPVTFEVGTSDSGSPRLNPKLGFRLYGVLGTSDLAIHSESSIHLINKSGSITRFKNDSMPLAIFAIEDTISVIRNSGQIVDLARE